MSFQLNGWQRNFRLGDACVIKHGYAFEGSKMTTSDDEELPIVVNIANFKYEGGFRFNTTPVQRYIDVPPEDYVLKPDDILVIMTCQTPKGEILGIPGRTPDDGNVYLHNQRLGLAKITAPNKLDKDFLYYVFCSAELNEHLYVTSTGTKVKHTAPSRIEEYRFDLPPLGEQRKIAAVLSAWDEAIALTEQLIDALKRRKQALMQRLLTGAVRFPEFGNAVQRQPVAFGTLPADWKYVTIGTVAEHVSIRNQADAALPVLSCTKYDGLVDSLQYFGRQIFSDDLSTYKVVRHGQFAYATNHIEEGSIGYQNLHTEALISPMYTVFETTDAVDDGFLYALLKTELYRHIFEANTSASVDRRGSLRWPEFSTIKIPLPCLEEQQAIADTLKIAQSEIDLQLGYCAALQLQKRGLMQQLLSGAVRVSNILAPNANTS